MSFRLTFSVDFGRSLQALNDLEKQIVGYAVPRDLDRVFQIALQEGMRNAPFRSGALRGSGVVRRTGPLARELEFTVDYAAATNAKHPTKAGWFDRSVDYISQTLPTNIQRTVREQAALAFRK